MYFAVLAPTIAFGGLLGEITHNQIGVMEALVGSSLVGVVYALLSGQPLSIMGITGPTGTKFNGLRPRLFWYSLPPQLCSLGVLT